MKASNTTKQNLRTTISEHLRGIAHDMGQEYHVPIVTPDIATRITSAAFQNYDRTNLGGGMHSMVPNSLRSCKTLPHMMPSWMGLQCS